MPARALQGWATWLLGDVLAAPRGWRGSWREITWSARDLWPDTLLTGFALADLGMHLVPTLLLLQLAAPHIDWRRSVARANLSLTSRGRRAACGLSRAVPPPPHRRSRVLLAAAAAWRARAHCVSFPPLLWFRAPGHGAARAAASRSASARRARGRSP